MHKLTHCPLNIMLANCVLKIANLRWWNYNYATCKLHSLPAGNMKWPVSTDTVLPSSVATSKLHQHSELKGYSVKWQKKLTMDSE